ncbi:MAG: class I SAM-dependent methyltransferase [Ilumatobacteraceae bacterium]|nr:class I SAM-dependent methyltransferase [Ilumatobacteraceae bacterium]
MSTPIDSSVYYHGIYWNSYDRVVQHLNERAFDSEQGNWSEYLRKEHGKPYSRALSMNCGTGWAERDLIHAGAAENVVGIDYLDDLLATARQAAIDMPISYHQTDANKADFPPGPYDLVVNHAGGHHIAFLDKVFRHLRKIMQPTGTLVTWDYTGPHRNQYTFRIWNAAMTVNERLPEEYRSPMDYPHLPTMLAGDPTEAIHSELVLEVMSRYFHHRHFRRLGGPIAYLLLTHNTRLYAAPPSERDPLVEMILAADVEHIEKYPADSLFTFALSVPRAEDEIDPLQLDLWTYEEESRESAAKAHGGRYYLPTKLELSRHLTTASDPDTGVTLLQPYDVARLGPRFVFGAVARLVPITFPFTLQSLRFLNRRLRSVRRRARR